MSRRLTALLSLTLLLAATACSSNSSSDPVSADRPTIGGMLGLVPNDEERRESIYVSLYGPAMEDLDLDLDLDLEGEGDTDGDEDPELDLLMTLTGARHSAVALHQPLLLGGVNAPEKIGDNGFVPSDLRAEIMSGKPPRQFTAGVGNLDVDEILDAADNTEGSERSTVEDVEVVSWLDDRSLDIGSDAPIGRPGQSGRIALPEDGLLLHAGDDESIREGIELHEGEGETLADDPDLAAVAEALDDAEVLAAHLTKPDEGVAADEAFEPITAVATGGSLRDSSPEFVMVLEHEDEGAAEANAEELTKVVENDASSFTNQDWSELLMDPEIEIDGTTVVAQFEVPAPRLWMDMAMTSFPILQSEE